MGTVPGAFSPTVSGMDPKRACETGLDRVAPTQTVS
jgi:hypothetical protein